MENQRPEALILATDRPSAIGDDLYQWALDAEDMIRRLHARVEELEKDRGNAKRLVSKIWNQLPEARDTIEKATGAWLVFGQDVETGGASAQRVTQSPTLKVSSDWLIDGGLLYRLNDSGTNCDEINVTMAGGLRTEAARVERAEAILNMLTIQKAADHIGKPSWDSHQWPQIVQDSSGNWFGVREGWTMRIAPSYKGDELWLLREDGEFLSHGECSQGWRTSLEQRPTTKPAPAELNLDDYYCKGCGRIGEIEELSAQDKAKLRKLAKDLDAVNLDRLGKALTKLGHATWVSQEEAAADIPRWVNALTSCVLEIPGAAPQPPADGRDAAWSDLKIAFDIPDGEDETHRYRHLDCQCEGRPEW